MFRKNVFAMAAAIALGAGSAPALAQGTAFTYQGQLKNSGAAVNTVTDLQFSLWTAASGGSQVGSTVTSLAVPVSQGLFSSAVDFGVNPYTSSQSLYLQIAVRNPAGSGSYVPMTSRQLLTPAPFSLATRGINVDASGNVGIGTLTPNRPLHVQGGGGVVSVERNGNYPMVTIGRYADNNTFVPSNEWKRFNIGTIGTGRNAGKLIIDDDQRESGGNGLLNTRMVIDNVGNVGIGTDTPQFSLDINGRLSSRGSNATGGGGLWMSDPQSPTTWGSFFGRSSAADAWTGAYSSSFGWTMIVKDSGNVGIGTTIPASRLDVRLPDNNPGDAIQFGSQTYCMGRLGEDPNTNTVWLGNIRNDGPIEFRIGGIQKAKVNTNGVFQVKTLQIDGGSDLVEGFDSQTSDIEPGTLMVIDPAHPGQLMPSTSAYDSKVAGIVSGAGGVNPGLKMGQDGVMDGKNLIAMTGRVYVKCTAGGAGGKIQPGDLLTTSDLAGHAMKASDRTLAPGATIGKAMSALDDGTGLVLVLVNLQ